MEIYSGINKLKIKRKTFACVDTKWKWNLKQQKNVEFYRLVDIAYVSANIYNAKGFL